MLIYYDPKTDLLEVLKRKCENFSKEIDDGIFEVRSQFSKKKIGQSLQDTSERIDDFDIFDPFVRLLIYIQMARLKRGFTQA